TINIANGENEQVFVADNGDYVMIYSPNDNGIGVKRSRDLVHWRDEPTLYLGQKDWPWAWTRITGGYAADFRQIPGVGKYVMLFHGSGPDKQRSDANENANNHVAIAWSDDLKNWDWPGKQAAPAATSR
ncbi:MAG: family 43 glycosylhydrolase, partial [Candidatus Hydrogenedentes bacterium]|nr:family 43 glycosylhydrolase [Candidatus Hydrogenedentota bacterium]